MLVLVVTLALLVGCWQVNPLDYHAIVLLDGIPYGSAVYIGEGVFISAKHIFKIKYKDVFVIYDGTVYGGEIEELEGDRVAIYTDCPSKRVAFISDKELKPGERVIWVQTLLLEKEIMMILVEGIVTPSPDKKIFYINEPAYPGASGTGVWNENGELVGIITSMINLTDGKNIPLYSRAERIK